MTILITLAIGYLLGSIPFSYLISKSMGHIDIREHGSGNSGTTNVIRVLGKKAGFTAFAGDFSKGVAASLFGLYFTGTIVGGYAAGLAAVIGHCYPFWIGFRGGKGVATSAGVIMGLSWQMGLILLVFQIGVIATTKFMSLASILSAALFPVLTVITYGLDIPFYLSIAFAALVIYRHRANVGRLLRGEESKFKLKK